MITSLKLKCFKAYDIRGRLGEELNEDIAYRVGRATAESQNTKSVIIGFDARATSLSLAKAVAKGICDTGADVLDIGLVGTEEVYAAVSEFNTDAGIEVTASHNPIEYTGMKIVKHQSQPLSADEFSKIKYLAEKGNFNHVVASGLTIDRKTEAREAYIEKILEFVKLESLESKKIVVNSGNGAAGPVIDSLNKKLKEKGIETNFVYVHHEPDPSFPNGIPNPLLEENRNATADIVVKEQAAFGVAFDGDFDRCFLFDHKGNFIPGEYMVGLLSDVFLRKEEGATIVHDPRVIWNMTDIVDKHKGHRVVSKSGHSFMKATMRDAGAVYGGEMSAHHYFRDFSYCDSGMIPWLMVWQLISETKSSLHDLVFERKSRFPSSGELNFTVANPAKCFQRVKDLFAVDATSIEEFDGVSMNFENWRFNLRRSNTEPLIRLNIETRGDQYLLVEKREELKNLIKEVSF